MSEEHRLSRAEQLAAVRAGLDVLRSGYRVSWVHPEGQTMGWPDYDPTVRAALNIAHEDVVGPDYEYLADFDTIAAKPIERATQRELSTLLTYVIRGERFADGHIASFIADGRLAAMFERVLEIADHEQ